MEQGSAEWHKARLGRVTASRISDVMAVGRDGQPSKTRAAYRAQLVTERISGSPYELVKTRAMEWGNDTEEQACAAYEIDNGQVAEQVGFIDHPSIPMSGASPDRVIVENSRIVGGLETKCPDTHTHFATLLGASIPRVYMMQCVFGMACTGADWWDYWTYDPRAPDGLQGYCQRINRDEKQIVAVEREVRKFLAEVDHEEAELRKMLAS